MLLPRVGLGCENTLQESFWGHPLNREQGPAPLAVITGPIGKRGSVMSFSNTVKLLSSESPRSSSFPTSPIAAYR